ncbi:DUF2971 domain-containing protein [Vibrio parahaemolyticus]|uniref:DUF2971 domain-containing protein n=2 Tax=Vibrio parahaemolyticus TaxID=670 RepID=UPI000156425D|nr:DUF2971 domain-containing protein [Vibrio parahaemolyticus]KIT41021.1 hypothetical protein H320_19305 [Vibrio parahaemolyticus 49]EDM59364.1 conserved hypothetical protein [Vibrio parahaemolyticus AQ3810]EGQ8734847.1 DUF2971 domain-containing protein [Vibrio parahaemolyticus]EGQ8886900.1 DUF2971 domain-containing protein [Vibrio parahaemolyticus]EGQ8917533.1 DUF2971 domain-containing protein [Vibrio parahaemolyticus]
MGKRFYRFRTLEKLLTAPYSELENQTIYFSPPETLNDPQEGYRDIYWKGDSILWRNLFKNYITSLETLVIEWNLMGSLEPINFDNMDVFRTIEEYPTPQYQALVNGICDRFLSDNGLKLLIEQLANRELPVRKNELETYLNLIHPYALQVIFEEYKANNLTSFEANFTTDRDNYLHEVLNNKWLSNIGKVIDSSKEDTDLESIFQLSKSIREQLHLSNLLGMEPIDESDTEKLNAFTNSLNMNKNFPSLYIKKLEDLAYPRWFTACFMSECENASVWGHYGNNHTGVCLIYESDDTNSLRIERPVSTSCSGTHSEFRPHQLKEITYSDSDSRAIDFFNSLGRLPAFKIHNHWFKSESGDISPNIDKFDSDEWRAKYWDEFHRDITLKNEDWAYEKEHRIILTSMLFDFCSVKDRCLKYDFKQLKGVIFGVRTPITDKVKIINIIQKLCDEHKLDSFEFYQASYSVSNNKIVNFPLNVFNIPTETST